MLALPAFSNSVIYFGVKLFDAGGLLCFIQIQIKSLLPITEFLINGISDAFPAMSLANEQNDILFEQ
jgi:hypothetical protein